MFKHSAESLYLVDCRQIVDLKYWEDPARYAHQTIILRTQAFFIF